MIVVIFFICNFEILYLLMYICIYIYTYEYTKIRIDSFDLWFVFAFVFVFMLVFAKRFFFVRPSLRRFRGSGDGGARFFAPSGENEHVCVFANVLVHRNVLANTNLLANTNTVLARSCIRETEKHLKYILLMYL